MHKIQKKILIIFLLFFIFYLINETFSLKFKEGAKGSKAKRAKATAAAKKNIIAHCKNTPRGKYKRYKMYKNDTLQPGCNVCKKKEKRKCIGPSHLNIHEATCKTSVCKRAYGEQMSDRFKIPGEIFDENKNPCMQIDFCKNCKKCNDGVYAGDFDCSKNCIEMEQTNSSSSGGWLSWFF